MKASAYRPPGSAAATAWSTRAPKMDATSSRDNTRCFLIEKASMGLGIAKRRALCNHFVRVPSSLAAKEVHHRPFELAFLQFVRAVPGAFHEQELGVGNPLCRLAEQRLGKKDVIRAADHQGRRPDAVEQFGAVVGQTRLERHEEIVRVGRPFAQERNQELIEGLLVLLYRHLPPVQ